MEQIKSILKKKEELQTKLSDTEDELKECQEGNFYIRQYNHQLTKARDDADAELENVNKIKSEAETEVKTLKEQNKKLVTNNLKTLEKLKHENGTLNRRVGELQDEYHKKEVLLQKKIDSFEHQIRNSLVCDQCEKVFASKSELRRHDINHHKPPKPLNSMKKRKCDFCEKLFVTKVDIQHHITA